MYTRPPRNDCLAYVDWLLSRMGDEDLSEAVWEFTLRPRTVKMLGELGATLAARGYDTVELNSIQETHVDAKGGRKTFIGRPLLWAYQRGALSAADLKKHVGAMLAIARSKRIKYEGLSSMSADEFEMIHGPPRLQSLDAAVWTLRHYTDTGLKEGAKLDYHFGLTAKDPKSCRAALKEAGLQPRRPLRDADWNISVVVRGKNDEKALRKAYSLMSKTARSAGGTLRGVLI